MRATLLMVTCVMAIGVIGLMLVSTPPALAASASHASAALAALPQSGNTDPDLDELKQQFEAFLEQLLLLAAEVPPIVTAAIKIAKQIDPADSGWVEGAIALLVLVAVVRRLK